ncbi:hypothetical protein [Mesorhizobium sp. WSM3876]|uniref:hypothetical protein n=1 Tax=Mesorhizobium sp. WSM3876 TaxID=422277 RepID=UPI000BC6C910|nr:hypothetical protein [Mesorhizobium sp. WSM3876]PBB85739.1 hypothetical protein CK216_16565 [Mesorhizobium sp. WSM3876]
MSAEQQKPKSDFVARCAIHPQFNGTGAVFDHAWLLYFQGTKKKRSLSVGWREYLPTDADVHAYGCRSAAIMNAGKLQRNGVAPEPLKDKAHYLGFFQFSIKGAVGLANEVYRLSFEHVPEHGEEAHAHISYEELDGIDKNVNKASARTDIVDKLWRLMSAPVRHICPDDEPHRADLEAIDLQNAQRPVTPAA